MEEIINKKEAKDIKFKIIDKETKRCAIISLADLMGYEGEDTGVFVAWDTGDNIPTWAKGKKISPRSGYGTSAKDDSFYFESFIDEV